MMVDGLLWVFFGLCTLGELWGCNTFFLPFTPVRGRHCMFIPSVSIFLWYLSPRLPACQLSLPWSEDIPYRLCIAYGRPSSKTQHTDRKLLLKLSLSVPHREELYTSSVALSCPSAQLNMCSNLITVSTKGLFVKFSHHITIFLIKEHSKRERSNQKVIWCHNLPWIQNCILFSLMYSSTRNRIGSRTKASIHYKADNMM